MDERVQLSRQMICIQWNFMERRNKKKRKQRKNALIDQISGSGSRAITNEANQKKNHRAEFS
jgi:hypothetical protein